MADETSGGGFTLPPILGDLLDTASDIADRIRQWKIDDIQFDLWKQQATSGTNYTDAIPNTSGTSWTPPTSTGGGNSSNIMLWIAIAGLALAAAGYFFPRRR